MPFELAPGVVINGRRRPPLRYVADFVYREKGSALDTIEDVKGAVTEAYRIKRHLRVGLPWSYCWREAARLSAQPALRHRRQPDCIPPMQ
nr:DUF1064 domain-containing protein [Ralstonia mannitolilytica]